MASDEAALRAAYPQVIAEVPGSPVFLVTLCKGARHIEVQVPEGASALSILFLCGSVFEVSPVLCDVAIVFT